MSPGEIHLAIFPFGGRVGSKIRPVLLLTGAVGTAPEVVVAYITSVIPASLMSTDVILDPTRTDHAGTNLKAISLLRLHKLATIHQSDLVRYLGNVPTLIWSNVESKLRLLLNL